MMSQEQDDETEEVYENLKEILGHIDPILRVTKSRRTFDEIVTYLRERQTNSPFALAKFIRKRLRQELGPLIDTEVQKTCSSKYESNVDGIEELKDEIVDRVMRSDEYNLIKFNIKHSIDEAVGRFMEEMKLDRLESGRNKCSIWSIPRQSSNSSFSDTDSLNGSLNLLELGLIKQDSLLEIAEKLHSKEHVNARIEALSTLCQVSAPDIFSGYQLSKLLEGLREALGSDCNELAQLSLQFHAKMLASSSHYAVKEMFGNLVSFLKNEFLSNNPSAFVASIDDGLFLDKPDHQHLLHIFRLLIKCQQNIVDQWVRYPDAYVKCLIDKSLDLLTLKLKNKSCFSTLDYFAVLDIDGRWFQKWMFTTYGRNKVLSNSKKIRQFLVLCTSVLLESISNAKHELPPSSCSEMICKNSNFFYSREILERIKVIHCIHIIGTFLLYTQGQNIFPLVVFHEEISTFQLVTNLIQFMFKSCQCSLLEEKEMYCLGHRISKILQNLVEFESSYYLIMKNPEIFDALFLPITETLHNLVSKVTERKLFLPMNNLYLVSEILICYARNDWSKQSFLLSTETDQKLNVLRIRAIDVFTTKLLRDELLIEQTEASCLKVQFLQLCKYLYSTSNFIYLLQGSQLPEAMYEIWKQSSNNSSCPSNVYNTTESTIDKLQIDPSEMLKYLSSFAASSLGRFRLQKLNILQDCICIIIEKAILKEKVSNIELSSFENALITEAALTVEGLQALEASGFLKIIINKLWDFAEYQIDDNSQKINFSEELVERSMNREVNKLLGIIVSFKAILLFFSNKKNSEDNISLPPKTITELLLVTAFKGRESAMKPLINPEQTLLMSLKLLSCLVSSLDIALFLQDKYQFKDVLLEAQEDNKVEDNPEIVIDALSVMRNYLLVKILEIGGPDEKILPPQKLNQNETTLELPLFSSSAFPVVYRVDISTHHPLTAAKELRNFIDQSTQEFTLNDWRKQYEQVLNSALSNCTHESLLFLVLEKSVEQRFKEWGASSSESFQDCSSQHSLPSVYFMGINLTVSYGCYLKLLPDSEKARNELIELMQLYFNSFIHSDLQLEFSGFPWFVATIFLMSEGNVDRTRSLLNDLYKTKGSNLLWFVHVPCALDSQLLNKLHCWLSHHIDQLLLAEEPQIHAAFKMSSYSPTLLCLHWTQQCFWNYLNWTEICNFIIISILMGPDFTIYFFLSVLHHLKDKILLHSQTHDLVTFLLEEPLHNFIISDYFKFMDSLSKKYKEPLLWHLAYCCYLSTED